MLSLTQCELLRTAGSTVDGSFGESPGDNDGSRRSFRYIQAPDDAAPFLTQRHLHRAGDGREIQFTTVENDRVRTSRKTLPACFQRVEAKHLRRQDGQRGARPGMVDRAAAPVFDADLPTLEQGVVIGMVDHEVVAPAGAFQRIVAMSHLEEGFHDVFLHEAAGVLFFLENLEKGGPIVAADYYILNNGTIEDSEHDLEKILKEIEF